ncbi:hypothetical protein RJ641_026794, partial [Dillenia turbinata]
MSSQRILASCQATLHLNRSGHQTRHLQVVETLIGDKMGQKNHTSDSNQTTDPKKRRRVGFSGPEYCFSSCSYGFDVDASVEANHCVKIYLVSSKEVVDAPANTCVIDPVDLNQFLITVWISSILFHVYTDVTFDSNSDGGKGITDLKPALQSIFAENLVDSKDDFLQTFSSESQCIKSLRLVMSKISVGYLYSPLVPLVLLLVDDSTPMEVTDPKWEIYVVTVKRYDQQGDCQCRLLGFTAIYHFYHFPDMTRMCLGQILVLPPYQHKGYEALNSVAIAEDIYDLTMEEPLDYLQHVRTCIDILCLLEFSSIQDAVNSAITALKQGKLSKKVQPPRLAPHLTVAEDVRKSLKIIKKQYLQCWEILIYLGLNPIDYTENFTEFISRRVKAKFLEKDSDTTSKRVIDVQSDYNPEMSFVLFKTQSDEGRSIELNGSKTNQEEQLRQLVVERIKEIKLIAGKVALQHAWLSASLYVHLSVGCNSKFLSSSTNPDELACAGAESLLT